MASDALEKVKQCSDNPNHKYPSSEIFAIATRDDKRKNIKLGEQNGKSLFSDLPRSVKSWANCKRPKPGVVSRENNDDWTDTDGDGKVDLISINADCQPNGFCEDEGGYTCSKILRWTGWRWVEISYETPA